MRILDHQEDEAHEPGGQMRGETLRSRLKAERRSKILNAAAQLFSAYGFRSVSIEDLGAAVGVSGPAVYRHFASKEAILSDLLVGVSQRLLDGGALEADASGSARQALRRLIDFHTDFALRDRNLIRLQDRDLTNLPPNQERTVRRLQRAYVEVWVEALMRFDPSLPADVARTRVHAVFGLLNSTPHSASNRDIEVTRRVLAEMAVLALVGSSLPEAVRVVSAADSDLACSNR